MIYDHHRLSTVRFTCTLSDTLFSEVKARYGAPERSDAGTVAAALDDLMSRGDDLCRDPDHQLMIADHQVMIARLEAAEADRDQAREDLATATADRDALTTRIAALEDQARTAAAEATRAREDLAARDQRLNEKADEINWLRAEVSKLNDKLTPAALPEKAGPGRRPWPLGWVDEILGRDPIRRP